MNTKVHFSQGKVLVFPLLQEVVTLCCTLALFIASGRLSHPLWFSPVPIVWQVNVSLLLGAVMGVRALWVLSLALFFSLLGYPVWAGGASGWTALCGPTGGYIIGYFLGTGCIVLLKRVCLWEKKLSLYGSLLLSNLLVYATGLLFLSHFVGWNDVLSLGFYPFLPGLFLKNILVTQCYFFLSERRIK